MLCCKDLKSSGIVLISPHQGFIILSKEDWGNEREEKGENSVKKYSMMIYALTLLALCGCSTVIQTSYGVAVDERKVGTIASDEQIKRTIQGKLLADDAIKILDISTFCYNSHVYLVGEYGTEKEKERALEIANHVQGVKAVTHYLLRIKKENTCGWRDNLEIGAKIRAKLIGDKDISSTNIDVKAIQCHVVLLGIVGSEKEVAKAIAHTKSVTGVRGVTSYLKAAN
jgi:hyperosmotically inducible protein